MQHSVHYSTQYVGVRGVTQPCVEAVMRYLQFGDRIHEARLLTCGSTHALTMRTDFDTIIAVRSGFSSGYPGEGPKGLSRVLFALVSLDVDIVELNVDSDLIERLDSACLAEADLAQILAPPPAFGGSVHKYVDPRHSLMKPGAFLRSSFPPVVPFGIVDDRLADLALVFWTNPDDCLMKAYRRLEEGVRRRTGVTENGSKLFSKALLGKQPLLVWPGVDHSEQVARGQLFGAAFSAFRNRRAHQEISDSDDHMLSEFLMVNMLFRLEAEAASVAHPTTDA